MKGVWNETSLKFILGFMGIIFASYLVFLVSDVFREDEEIFESYVECDCSAEVAQADCC